MINCNEGENDNDKIDHINKTYSAQDVDIGTDTKNIVCLGKTMSLCNKQHLSNFEAQFVRKLSNTEAELKNHV